VTAEGLVPLLGRLADRARRGMELGLGPTQAALAELGEPHLALAVAHVAGTNGKGSVCAMVESIARAAGLRTGLYTSPHLCRFAERIRLDGEPIDDDAFARALGRVLACRTDLTFFESLTVAAFDAFREASVDLAIVEVGLGGRLDATNVIPAPLCTAITSIAFDHTAILGTTLDAIAREKAGILKPGVPVVLGAIPPEAERAIEEIANALGASPLIARAPSVAAVGLEGPHQQRNAAVATAIAGVLSARWPRIAAAVAPGLRDVRWPGRLERIERAGVTVLLDAAHNAEGARALADALASSAPPSERVTLVFGALADKPWPEMLSLLAPLAGRRIYTSPKGRAAAPLSELVQVAPGEPIDAPTDALERALDAARPGDTVLVTGSIYLVGELRGRLLGQACDPPIGL